MRVSFNPRIFSNQLYTTKRNAQTITLTKSSDANHIIANTGFTGKKSDRAGAVLAATLVLTTIGKPAPATNIPVLEKPVMGIQDTSGFERKSEAALKMQETARRIFELNEEIIQTDKEAEQYNDLEILMFDVTSILQDKVSNAESKKEKEKFMEERSIAENIRFKLLNKYAVASSSNSVCRGTRDWLCEELYRLQGIKTGTEVANVKMPVSEKFYNYSDVEAERGEEGSAKNSLYRQFENRTLEECENTTLAGIIGRIRELTKLEQELKPAASYYLSGVEKRRAGITAVKSEIKSVREKIEQIEEQNDKNISDSTDSKESDELTALKKELKKLEDQRDNISREWNLFDKEHEGKYREYIETILKITVLEGYLNETYE